MSQAEFSKQTGITKSSVNMYERGEREPGLDRLEIIADFYNVDMDFLLGKSDIKNKTKLLERQKEQPANSLPPLSPRDKRDIAKKLEETLDLLENSNDGLMFDGEPLDDETRELLRASLQNQLEMTKRLAKQKFTPKKYRK